MTDETPNIETPPGVTAEMRAFATEWGRAAGEAMAIGDTARVAQNQNYWGRWLVAWTTPGLDREALKLIRKVAYATAANRRGRR